MFMANCKWLLGFLWQKIYLNIQGDHLLVREFKNFFDNKAFALNDFIKKVHEVLKNSLNSSQLQRIRFQIK